MAKITPRQLNNWRFSSPEGMPNITLTKQACEWTRKAGFVYKDTEGGYKELLNGYKEPVKQAIKVTDPESSQDLKTELAAIDQIASNAEHLVRQNINSLTLSLRVFTIQHLTQTHAEKMIACFRKLVHNLVGNERCSRNSPTRLCVQLNKTAWPNILGMSDRSTFPPRTRWKCGLKAEHS
ncbi:hypothetical protein K469DRAFT_694324 [Zopfia rhizophila CBS 207.26]|uniref:Uncharacterized protein n=1 Tax=Zopfia rhizophila CBS 207.26 TaxID=1314779 RepID=A0A6A6EJ88_9PEZI|nr:hypothetical protein K469DRAFT_694324 [Zopfia rhizophila CBS 207.26]